MSEVYMRKAENTDLNRVCQLIEMGRGLLKQDHSPQWQDGNPSPALIRQDIQERRGYVLIYEEVIVGYGALIKAPDPAYEKIEAGQWKPGNKAYASIHRVVVNPEYKGKGFGQIILKLLKEKALVKGFSDIRIDTHEKNLRMRHLITKLGFSYQGIIYVDESKEGKRLAYQWVLRGFDNKVEVRSMAPPIS